MPDVPQLRYADITDTMMSRREERIIRVCGFYRIIEEDIPAFLGGGHVRSLVNCLPDDPRMEVVSGVAACGTYHRPWDLEWVGPIPWDAKTVDLYRTDWRADVQRSDDRDPLRSTSYPELFQRFPPLTNHEHLLIAQWRRDTDARIRAYAARMAEAYPA
jgi:hypothetical protein